MSLRVFVVAAESSGDALAADLIDSLRARDPGIVVGGVGGARMQSRGVTSPFDIADLAVLGLFDGLKAYARVVKKADEATAAAMAFKPDLVVLVDSWGFTLRVGQRIRAQAPSIKLLKYVGPQVWATRPGRAKTLAGVVDHLVCIHDFEPPFYAPHNLPCTVCGHPAIGRHRPADGAAFRTRHKLTPQSKLLLLLPGSRRSELKRTAPHIFDAAAKVVQAQPSTQVMIVAAGPVAAQVKAMAARQPYPSILVDEDADKEAAFAAATAAIAASGTVTTEVALQRTPVVVGYRLGWLTWFLARAFLYKPRFATLMNIAADKEVAPEFLQSRCTADNLALAAMPLLADASVRAAQVSAQNSALGAMGEGNRPASEYAADAVFRLAETPVAAAQRAIA